MPEKQVLLDPDAGAVEVVITPLALHTVGYFFYLFDSSGNPANAIKVIGPGFITDQAGDPFFLPIAASNLDGYALKWYIDIGTATGSTDPEDYAIEIDVLQNGSPALGDSKITVAPNQGKFTTALHYTDFVRLRNH